MLAGRINWLGNAGALLKVAVLLSISCCLHASLIYDNQTWFASGTSAGLTLVNGKLQLNTAGGNSGVLAYFASNPVLLGVDDSLQVSFNFTLSGPLAPQDRAFGVFLYNSGGSRLTTDDTSGFNKALFSGYTGYGITYDPDSTNPARYRTVERTLLINNLLSSTANPNLGTPKASSVLTPGQTYSGYLTLTRTGTSIIVAGAINGSLISNIDLISPYTQFDTIAFMALNSDIPVLTLSNIEVNESSVPEPSTVTFAVLGLLFLLARKVRERVILGSLLV